MSSHRAAFCIVAFGAALLVACVRRNTAPSDFLPTPQTAGQHVRGGWVDVRVRTGSTVDSLRGEVLAVSRDSLWIQPPGASGVVIARNAIESGKITSFRSSGSVATSTTLGVLSTIANGFILVFTAPAWIVTGSISRHADARAAERDLPDDFNRAEVDLRAVARFPQGMPPRMDASFRRRPRAR